MYQNLTIKIDESCFNDAFIPLIRSYPETRKNIILLSGGRASGKSRGIVQYLNDELTVNKRRVAFVRKVKDTIRESSYREFQLQTEDWQIGDLYKFKVSPLEIITPHGSQILCLGLDKAVKVKSLAQVDIVWIEEATELTYDDWLSLSFTVLRGKDDRKIILSYNPQVGHWINDEFFYADGKPKEHIYHLHTTYLQNKFAGETLKRLMEQLKQKDPILYEIHGLGKLRQPKNIIYPDYEIVDSFPENIDYVYGVDPGFNNAFAFSRVAKTHDTLYLDEIFYASGMNVSDVINAVKDRLAPHDLRKWFFVDDSAPLVTSELVKAGFMATKANKGKVRDGILQIKGMKLAITRRSHNLLKEIKNYKWQEDTNGIILEEPVDAFNDLCDSFRYAAINILRNLYNPWAK